MLSLLSNIKIQVPEKLYLKDPESSDLGKKIVANSIEMINEMGFEVFTFKKLGTRIGSPESTIYRYFENKHKLLIYLTSWYWGWLEYKVVFSTANISNVKERLEKAITSIAETAIPDQKFQHINEWALQQIVISESTKAFLTKEVDSENKEGYFDNYKRLCERLSQIVREVNPSYKHSHTLVTTILEGCHLQKFFGQHLPSLTEIKHDDQSARNFFVDMTLRTLSK